MRGNLTDRDELSARANRNYVETSILKHGGKSGGHSLYLDWL